MGYRTRLALVAATVLIALGSVGYYSTILLWEDIRPYRSYKVSFGRTQGLSKNDDVFVYGLKIGRVHEVKLKGDHQLVEIQVDPSVTLYRDGARVEIRSVDAFGTVAVFLDPGRVDSEVSYGPNDTITGILLGGLVEAPEDSASPRALSEALHNFQEVTEGLRSIDGSSSGRLLNDPDYAVNLKEAVEELAGSVRAAHASIVEAEHDQGSFGILSVDASADVVNASASARESLFTLAGSLRATARGEEGFAARLAGDPGVAASTSDALAGLASLFADYRSAEGRVPAFLAHPPEGGERFLERLGAVEESTGAALRGEGGAGAFFGPGTGANMKETLSQLDATLDAGRHADSSVGTYLSPTPAGRRDIEEGLLRIEDVLREMRQALTRIRADQSPNTFQGAVFAVF